MSILRAFLASYGEEDDQLIKQDQNLKTSSRLLAIIKSLFDLVGLLIAVISLHN